MKRLLLIALLLAAFASCKKDNTPVTIINIDGKEFKAKIKEGYIINGESYFGFSSTMENHSYSFDLVFNTLYFPKSGVFNIKFARGSTYQDVGFAFNRDTSAWMVSRQNTTTLTAYNENGKGKYMMSPTWVYIHYGDSALGTYVPGQDSVLVSATFYEPYNIVRR